MDLSHLQQYSEEPVMRHPADSLIANAATQIAGVQSVRSCLESAQLCAVSGRGES
jgi:hypothetical protein